MANLFRIKKSFKITYQETEAETVNYSTATKNNKYAIIAFIRNSYPNTCIRDIIRGNYKAIIDSGFLVGTQYKLTNKNK